MKASDFIHSLPERVKPEVLEGLASRFHFVFSGDDPGTFTVEVEDGSLHVNEGLEGEPDCVVKADSGDFTKILSGELNPMMAALTGKLKVSNQGLMLKYAKIFGLM